MKRAQLELALRLAGEVARDSEFIVFGSQSILGTVGRPPKTCLVSMEVDIYPRHHPQAVGLIAARLLKTKVLRERILTLPITPASQDEALNQIHRLQIRPSRGKK